MMKAERQRGCINIILAGHQIQGPERHTWRHEGMHIGFVSAIEEHIVVTG